MSNRALHAHRNHLLRALPARELRIVQTHLEAIDLERGAVLADVGDPIRHMYFPETAVLSINQPYASGDSVEVAAVGCEGMIDIAVALRNAERSTARHVVQFDGRAMRLKRGDFDMLFQSQTVFRKLIHTFAAGFIASTLLSIACNRLHLVEARLARWLLIALDRSVDHILPLTHEVIAEMLGVHRPTVTVTLQLIEKSGALRVSRGRVEIVDRAILESIACECYHRAVEQLPAGCGA